MAITIKFTPLELEVIQHRLDVPDALEDCLTDEDQFSAEIVQESIVRLTRLIHQGEFAEHNLTPCERAILIDCVEGSTFFPGTEDAVACGEITRGKALANYKAANSIERKLKKIGIICHFPGY